MSEKPPRKTFSHDARKVDAVDRVIAARIAQRRMSLRMTKVHLATQVGLTFQQIQKYENGSNRVSAGTLFKLAKALGVTVNYFYEGAGEIETMEAPFDFERLVAEGGSDLATDFLALPVPQRKMVTSLARSLASAQTEEKKT